MVSEPCGVDACPAAATGRNGFCAVHEGAKRLKHVMSGSKCQKCKHALRAGEWVTRESTLDALAHAVCPTPARRVALEQLRLDFNGAALIDADDLPF